MKKLKFTYRMDLTFSEEADSNYFTFRCLPKEGNGQHVLELSYEVSPSDYVSEGVDGLGNSYLYGAVTEKHQFLTLKVSGLVSSGGNTSFGEGEHLHGLYRRQSALTTPGKRILALSEKIHPSWHTVDYAMLCAHALKWEMTYTPGVTDSSTTAEEALEKQQGVCQDYAHVLLSLLRLRGIPSRYCAGLMVGEGQTHAWVEFHTPSGWVGIDPTSSRMTDDRYLVLSTGLDASDCLVNKGVVRLNGTQKLTVMAKTEIVEE